MGKVGIGTYRMSVKSQKHKDNLLYALNNDCKLIDTSANYTDGDSELLIGSILEKNPQLTPIIVTKGGYIQGQNLKHLQNLQNQNKALDEIVTINENLKHSIHPDFLKNQIDLSLNRLNRASLDVFLLHNPEYYFETENAEASEYYRRIKKAFSYLEEEVHHGRIKSYGISSNTFINPINDPKVTNLEKILTIASEVATNHHFGHIQFPFNLIEIGALEKNDDYGSFSLIEMANMNQLTTMTNRPLNAFLNGQLLRLATYEEAEAKLNSDEAENHFEKCWELLKNKFNNERVSEDENFEDIAILNQFKNIWKSISTPDAVDQVYHGHLYPFIAQLWGGALTPQESQPFYQLYEYSELYARLNMQNKAYQFKADAVRLNLLPTSSTKKFSVDVIETYLDYGIDWVLVGMREKHYIDQLKHLF